MIIPVFTFDDEANGWLSEPFTIEEECTVHIELARKAPVVTMKKENDGGYANYGQTPEESDRYELNLTSDQEETIILATPVEVTNCYIIN